MKFAPRYELIFALDNQTADALAVSATRHLATDPSIESICDRYYEPSDLTAKKQAKFARRQQYRVRRIERTWDVLLESLSWERDACSLRQTVVPSSDLANLLSDVIDKSWSGKWFHKKLNKHRLVPSLETSFDQTTWTCDSLDGEIRLTLDRNIQAQHTSLVSVASDIVRMNFAVSLPSKLKALIYEFALLPESPDVLLELSRTSKIGGSTISQDQTITPVVIGLKQEVATCQVG